MITSVARWFFIDSIFGAALIAAGLYFVAAGIKKLAPKFPNPFAISAIFFFVSIFTLPSIPRYEFEKEALSQIEGKGWIRVINKTKWGDITEPLTWFHAPVGSVFTVMPESPLEDSYREILLRYKEEPRIRLSEPDCQEKTIRYSEPDSEGVFRYKSLERQTMNEQEMAIYCESNWTKEKEALRAEMLRLVK